MSENTLASILQQVDAVIKTELVADVTDLDLSTPPATASLRRSPRKRTATIRLTQESSDEDNTKGSTPKRTVRRKLAVKKEEDRDDVLPTALPAAKAKTASKRTAGARSTSASPRKVKREYAPPETYAHLDPLNDLLKEHLDVMFCGINPGKKSAEVGFHFAHSTNHFWRAIHLAGFTDRLLKPSEEAQLPTTYNVGLTDLVERPSAEQAELSLGDMHAGVPILLAKIVRYAPRVVCFVGKQIGETFLTEAASLSPPPLAPTPSADAGEASAKAKKPRTKKPKVEIGFAPYKVVHAPDAPVRETLFFVMPSTSARVTGYQLADKAKILRTLHDEVGRMRRGEGLDTGAMQVIAVPIGHAVSTV
ncbi:mismatch-specific DNA-glycosylase [Phanerochaete sordida]|uniref:Mismatch-specific DNA-glycosylase n=1 Tax=Phanerochaete sordida TaxID=48140 RepID=A0A9P3G853_9APHY|nr:mismatch-specific DNA-glycosylase [Phanerochaete sordida]